METTVTTPRPAVKKAIKAEKPKITFPEPDIKYDFPVDFEDMKTKSGIIIPGRRAVVRTDTKRVLGVVGSDYKIIPNKELLSQIEKTLPVALGTRHIHITDEGKYMFARYMSPKIKSVTVAKGDVIQFGVEIFNSYNGKMALGMRMFALRLVCTNGMTTPHSVSTIQVRHTGSANLVEARKEFEQKVTLFQKYGEQWQRWLTVTPKETDMKAFLKKRISSETARGTIMTKFEADKDKSLWGFFNSVTWYGTHVLKPKFVTNKEESNPNKLTTVVSKHRDSAKLQFRFAKRVIEPFYAVNWSGK